MWKWKNPPVKNLCCNKQKNQDFKRNLQCEDFFYPFQKRHYVYYSKIVVSNKLGKISLKNLSVIIKLLNEHFVIYAFKDPFNRVVFISAIRPRTHNELCPISLLFTVSYQSHEMN